MYCWTCAQDSYVTQEPAKELQVFLFAIPFDKAELGHSDSCLYLIFIFQFLGIMIPLQRMFYIFLEINFFIHLPAY